MATDTDDIDDFIEALTDFIDGEGVLLFQQKLADKFRKDAPSKSGKSKKAIKDIPTGFELPLSLIYTSEGNRSKDGIVSGGSGFIDDILDESELELWLEVIQEWADSEGIVDTITID